MAIATGTALAISAAAGAGASIYGAHKASGASKQAAAQQAAAGREAAALQAPYREVGGQGLTALSSLLGLGGGPIGAGLETTPGYQFRLGEGLKALERSAASRGTLLTGGTLKGMQRYAQDVASQEYDKRVNQLGNIAGIGQRASESSGELLTGIGNAQAAGTVGSANAWQQGLGQAGNIAQMYYLSRLMQPTPYAVPVTPPGPAITPPTVAGAPGAGGYWPSSPVLMS